jgi:methylated-DNA-[protein]-cysteine S-methyltransferase
MTTSRTTPVATTVRTVTTTVDSPVGPLLLRGTDDSDFRLTELLFGASDSKHRAVPTAADREDQTAFTAVVAQLGEFFAGDRTNFDLPLAPRGTDFQQRVWLALREIPYGETRTYAEIAGLIGAPTAVRAVGAANGRNPLSIVVPCHRVIGADGSLTGFGGGLTAKRWLLTHERAVAPAADALF